MSEVEEKLKELWKKEEDITIRKRAERDLREKRKLEIEQGKIYVETQKLQQQLDNELNKQADKKINTLLTDHRQAIFFSVNREKKMIPENLEVELAFQPCGHKKKIPVREGLRNEGESNIIVLTRWQRIFEHGELYERSYSCEQCKNEANDLLAKFRIRRGTEIIGQCKIVIRLLQ